MRGFALLLIGLCFGIWWWRKNYYPSPLEVHYADLANKALIGATAQASAFLAQPVSAMVGSGWGTTCQINPNNPASLTHNTPGWLQLNVRAVQPTSP